MKLVDVSIREFIKQLGTGNPTPGGGSVAALCGALGSALSSMVSELTLGRERLKHSWQSMEEVKQGAGTLSNRFLNLTQQDTEAYEGVIAALRLPKETEEQKAARHAATQEAMEKAANIPLETLRSAETLMEIAKVAVERGNPATITDAAAAAQVARTAAAVASYNVLVNLPDIEDEQFVAESRKEVGEILERVNAIARKTEECVIARLL
ncbi:MAG: cyclodeaminase/cyclohydrolase family protein [Deltaproteobacteria bacterium]|nr:MAG: cyclodeaminase/cyclohydrolase family protein [Deltaproteobacteria bacterium]